MSDELKSCPLFTVYASLQRIVRARNYHGLPKHHDQAWYDKAELALDAARECLCHRMR